MSNDICKGCDLYVDDHCIKFRRNGKCKPMGRDYLDSIEKNDGEFISVDRMCRHASIFGNIFVGLTLEDIERIKNGEIVHIPDEYGTFIGLKEGENV